MPINNPYHEGELAVQQRVDAAAMARMNGAAVDDTILGGALRFIEQQAMLVIGSVDARGQVWSSLLFGPAGFVRAVDKCTVEIDVSQPRSSGDDPLWQNLQQNPNVGLLVIELGSRRRLRINGKANKLADDSYVIEVERSYPNCPKYIQGRQLKISPQGQAPALSAVEAGTALGARQKSLIAGADTLFVASAHPEHGVDASHRGGHPGFVKIINDRQLRIPDFVGNSMFNTLGNFVSYPHAGLVFIDFERNRLLQLTGTPQILWELDDPQGETGGTRRFWQFDISAWQENPLPVELAWEFLEASPHIPELKDTSANDSVLRLEVVRIRRESDRVKSFRLRASGGASLPAFQSGAHLPVTVTLPDGSRARRQYSLLSDPAEHAFYEIGVLRETQGGGGSRFMHEQVKEGDVLEFAAPGNEFPMAAHARHSILIAGGIGITPIHSMMHSLAAQGHSFELHYTARSRAGLVFRDRIERVAGDRASFYVSGEPDGQRLDLQQLLHTPTAGVHVYVCGPRRMIKAVRDIAAARGWSEAQIHFESFGARALPGDQPIEVHLERSRQTISVPAERSILDTLLHAGIDVAHDCKRGECGMCATRVVDGEAEHRDLCLSAEQQADSICVCVSRACGRSLRLDL